MPFQDSYVYKNILATVEKADRIDFLEEESSTSMGFHDDKNRYLCNL